MQYKVKLFTVTFLCEATDGNSARTITFATKSEAFEFIKGEMDYYEEEYGKDKYETKKVYNDYAVLNYADIFFTWDVCEDIVIVDESAVTRVE